MSASPPPVPRDVPEVQPDGRALRNWMNDLLRFLGSSGGTGTVTEIDTTAPITGGPITTSGTIGVSTMTGDSGAGGATGVVPAPAAGDAAAGKFLKASGAWAVPSAGATITTQDEGSTLSSTVNTLNFVGAGVTASGGGATTTVTIPQGVTSVGSADGSVTVTNPTTTPDLSVNTTTPNAIQAALANRIASMSMWTSNGSVQTVGQLIGALGSLGGPLVTPVYTTPLSMTRRAAYTSTAVISQSAGFTASRCDVFRGSATWGGGFMVAHTFGFEQLNADSRVMICLNSTVSGVGLAGVDPSSNIPAAGYFGIGLDAADTQWQIITATTSGGGSTKTALGVSWPRPTVATELYRVWFYCNANASGISVRLDKYTTSGTTTFTSTVTSNIPTAATTLNVSAGCGTGPTTATAVKYAPSQLTIEQFTP